MIFPHLTQPVESIDLQLGRRSSGRVPLLRLFGADSAAPGVICTRLIKLRPFSGRSCTDCCVTLLPIEDELSLGSLGSYLVAMDYKTGKPAWKHRYPGVGGGGQLTGLLTTAGHLLFAPDAKGTLVAHDAATGKQLWYSRINETNAPETYMLDGHQWVIAGGNDTVYAFRLQ